MDDLVASACSSVAATKRHCLQCTGAPQWRAHCGKLGRACLRAGAFLQGLQLCSQSLQGEMGREWGQ